MVIRHLDIPSQEMYDDFLEFLNNKLNVEITPAGYIAGPEEVYFIISKGDWNTLNILTIRKALSASNKQLNSILVEYAESLKN